MHLERHWLSRVVRQNPVAHRNTMPRASDKVEKAPRNLGAHREGSTFPTSSQRPKQQ